MSMVHACRATIAGVLPILLGVVAPPAHASREGEEQFVVVKAARVITVTGEAVERGEIVIVDGEISLVGVGLEYPGNAEVIDARTETVAPGFIHPRSRFGLGRVSRSGVNGAATVADELYLGEIDFEPALRHGYTALAMYPGGSGIAGRASVYRTAGPDDDRLLNAGAYVRIDFTSQPSARNTLDGALKKAKAEIEKLEKAREAWEKKKAEWEKTQKQEAERKQAEKQQKKGDDAEKKPASSSDDGGGDPEQDADAKGDEKDEGPGEFEPPPIDPNLQPLVDLLQGEAAAPALIEIRRASDLLHLEQVLEPYDELEHRIALLAVRFADYNHAVERLGGAEAHVAMTPDLATLPQTTTYVNVAAELARAGCLLTFMPAFDAESGLAQVRQRAAELVRAGLDRDAALKAMTLHPAKLLGVDDKFGSIEAEREADLVFLSGDPFDAGTRVTRVMIEGEIVWELDAEDESR